MLISIQGLAGFSPFSNPGGFVSKASSIGIKSLADLIILLIIFLAACTLRSKELWNGSYSNQLMGLMVLVT